ncbi:hypothetical protein [Lachnoanaerobaculum gingivalis]|uniref:hypothetical protein n=1 Tax=Lachnoanaerobaculum gingivalis TaxID=2490855 RepID=UPI0024A66DE7|nr:hypothetical protein [Lachnoanaerobaculum gingivalis]WHE86699.1 hypothetical protein QJR73_10480 [Lachnoanaerobaculum gingivalis]
MMKKRRIQMIIIILVTICLYIVYIMNNIAFFKDKEFERAVRETLISSRVSMVDRREKALGGIIWKRDLERVQSVSINFREYKVKNIEDIKYFKNTKTVWFSYISAYDGDNSIYEEEYVLDNIYLIKKFKYLEDLHLYHLKINEDIKAMFPNVDVFIE